TAPSTPVGGSKPAADAKPPSPPTQAPPPATAVALKVDVGPQPTQAPAAATKPAAVPATGSGKYREAPQLADLVKQGKLPPIEQRLPESPRVTKPLEETGQHGGVWHRA